MRRGLDDWWWHECGGGHRCHVWGSLGSEPGGGSGNPVKGWDSILSQKREQSQTTCSFWSFRVPDQSNSARSIEIDSPRGEFGMDDQIYSEGFRWSTPEVDHGSRKASRTLGLLGCPTFQDEAFWSEQDPTQVTCDRAGNQSQF